MLPCLLAVAAPTYEFQALDFVPNDLNDDGWVVGESRIPRDHGFRTAAVLMRDGKTLDLGGFGGTGAAVRVNDRGAVLIQCEPWAVPPSLRNGGAAPDKEGPGPALLLWSAGKASYLGRFEALGSFLEDGRFLARLPSGEQRLVTVRKGAATSRALPKISVPGSRLRHPVSYSDVNESGTLVGMTDLGTDLSYAVRVDRRGRATVLQPEVAIHTGWSARLVNARGEILGFHTFDFSIGGGAHFVWRAGKISDLPSIGLTDGRTDYAASFNDRGQAVGTVDLYLSGAVAGKLRDGERVAPYRATPTAHAVLWTDGRCLNLNDVTNKPADCVLTDAAKINNRGWIVGTAVQGGSRIGYLLRPNRQRQTGGTAIRV